MKSLLSTNKLIQKTIPPTSEMEVRYSQLYKFSVEPSLLVSSVNDTQIHRIDFAKYFETLKAQMKYQDEIHFDKKQIN